MEKRKIQGYDWKTHVTKWVISMEGHCFSIHANHYKVNKKKDKVDFIAEWDNNHKAVIATFPWSKIIAIYDESCASSYD
jgi:hypothetical protein